jgi:hypothetical protein
MLESFPAHLVRTRPVPILFSWFGKRGSASMATWRATKRDLVAYAYPWPSHVAETVVVTKYATVQRTRQINGPGRVRDAGRI